ncbi:MAG: endonuclease [Spirochaetes bacterium]|nr:endonuclease [Spirochaetota bacterium]
MHILKRVYQQLLSHYGPQHWWPAETSFEVTIGAILAQNISWANAAKAVENLKKHKLLSPQALYKKSAGAIAPYITSSGYYNQKAGAIAAFLHWFKQYDFSFESLQRLPTDTLRKELLSLPRIGPETCDSILLYALNRKIFVVDAYTKRIFTRFGILTGNEDYMAIQEFFHKNFEGTVQDYNEYHALIVKHGKDVCTKKPHCDKCCIAQVCGKVL